MKDFFDIVLYFAENPNKYFTARDIRVKFNLEKDPNDWPAYGLLSWLARGGYLIKGPKGKGFIYKRQSAYAKDTDKIRAV